MTELEIVQMNEYELSAAQRAQILALLKDCFPGYFEERHFFKQMSQQRLLAYVDGTLVGQLGLEHRAIRVGDQCATIFGVVDLCVREKERRQGVATALMKTVEQTAKTHDIHFCLLFADEHDFYQKLGYRHTKNNCIWLGIDDGQSTGLIERQVTDCMLVKRISGEIDWNETQTIDLLGHLF
ncbi:GNAT family N-acetyltransferase [Gimesia chilikensis]|jgi:predicted N-acetyltransferase YhbS|uniref:Acetyltransferase (GNAT) family protein n=1 Tax=Gimesia chilikensis TaxID=2605989 RepID=A0A517PZ51_9PLAN|nr:GNAT family N-acetyltransferase [Gimesia chilikensis]QDT24640.1 Acetyltransferase (GNAT) family protein [Gimesia chilikensis]